MIPGHHSGRREAKAAGLKEVPNREFRDRGGGKYLTQGLPPVVLPECEIRTPSVREVEQPFSLSLSDESLCMLVHSGSPCGSVQ
eukprot:3922559-Rhodomonas_salina.1